MIKQVIKRDGSREKFDLSKIREAIRGCYEDIKLPVRRLSEIMDIVESALPQDQDTIRIERIQNIIEETLMKTGEYKAARQFIQYRADHKRIRDYVKEKSDFIEKYKRASNTANATVDDNANVGGRNVGILNAEIHKEDNIKISRGIVMSKLKELFPDFDAKQYERDLNNHIIYKHDESSAPAIYPYCVAITMYPFILNGIRDLGGLSAAPKNLDSYCGLYVNLVFAIAAQFAGAVATPEFLLFFDYFARKEWGDDYYKDPDRVIAPGSSHDSIIKTIHQKFQQVIYCINQPAGSRGSQSAFTNFSYFDHPFFNSMFENFVFPDGSKPVWESLSWLQKDFMMWFNEERLRTVITFPVESFALIYKDGKFEDEESARFVADELARGHSFFVYVSDTADSLSSCCRLKNKIQTKEFSFTNGNIGVQTGSKSVITLNLSRIIQDWGRKNGHDSLLNDENEKESLRSYIRSILDRVYKYHIAYNERLWDMNDAGLLTVYKAGFIHLDKQYLTIGLNGLNQAAEWLGLECTDNDDYRRFCQLIFGTIKEYNTEHNGKFNGHKLSFNTELVPAESLAVKNYNWDKADGYWVPEKENLYASYIFKPDDPSLNILQKIEMHGKDWIGEYLDGGSAAHLNLSEHLTSDQYWRLLNWMGEKGCNYATWNIPMSECRDCHHIVNAPIKECPVCGSKNIKYYTRIIGYLTPVDSWSEGRKKEFGMRVFGDGIEGKGGETYEVR